MPIVINRSTGKVVSAPALTPEQREAAWEAIIRAHVRRHPEIFQSQNQEKVNPTN